MIKTGRDRQTDRQRDIYRERGERERVEISTKKMESDRVRENHTAS